ncbi:flagellar hook-basal body complex protein, partial [Lentibacillus sp.]|uniref:flagellar hook-basal body complex protein n=1 Tax=Lentibacillus sp. TaxID=1925746 RepID=UPI002B4B70DF
PEGLQKDGGSIYLETNNSGVPTIQEPETGGAATIVSGALEMSNVDLAEEFTEMITAQRGFQANTRIITTSDEILQELVNLKR